MTDEGAWRLEFASRARRDLKRLDPPIARRILAGIEGLIDDPPSGDRRKLTGHDDEWRLRVGDWRVRFTRHADTQMLVIQRVLPRGRAYRD